MANPFIQYDPGSGVQTINFPQVLEDLRGPGRIPDRTMRRSRSGIEIHHFYNFYEEWEAVASRMSIDDSVVAIFMDNITAFWSWAGKGEEFKFAVDAADPYMKTLDGTAAAGQKVIPLDSTTGLTVGNKYHIDMVSGGHAREVVEIASITAGVSVTAVNNLIYAYVSGDVFRSRLYFPNCVATDQVNPIREREGKRVDFQLKFRTFVTLV